MRPREKAKRKQGKGEVRSLSRRGQRLMRKVTCWVSQTLWLKGCCEEEGRWRRKRNKMDEAWFTVLGTLGQYRACVPECSEWSSEELSTVGCALQCNAGPSLIPGRNRHPGPSGLVLVQQSSVQGYLRPGRHGETMQTRPRRQGLESRPVAMLASFNVNKCPPGVVAMVTVILAPVGAGRRMDPLFSSCLRPRPGTLFCSSSFFFSLSSPFIESVIDNSLDCSVGQRGARAEARAGGSLLPSSHHHPWTLWPRRRHGSFC